MGSTVAEACNGTSCEIETTPNPSAAWESDLSAVSCISALVCAAVGGHLVTGSDGEVTLAEVSSGTTWSTENTANPKGTSYSLLLGLSCASDVRCTAVGFFDNRSGAQMTLVEAWNGTMWTIEKTPNPTGSKGQ
jgi:hypothetical protein